MTTDTSEVEELILRAMTGRTDALSLAHKATETAVPVAGGTGVTRATTIATTRSTWSSSLRRGRAGRHPPTPEQEATRDLVRCRESAKADLALLVTAY
jgi:hypothetical protein